MKTGGKRNARPRYTTVMFSFMAQFYCLSHVSCLARSSFGLVYNKVRSTAKDDVRMWSLCLKPAHNGFTSVGTMFGAVDRTAVVQS